MSILLNTKDNAFISKTIVVNQNHPQAADMNLGSEEKPLKTINAAAVIAKAGDTILVREGVYREEVVPQNSGSESAPITFLAMPNESVYIKGSDLYEGEWEATETKGVYRAKLDMDCLKAFNPFATEFIYNLEDYKREMNDVIKKLTCGQVFVNGNMLNEQDNECDLQNIPGTWLVENGGEALLVHFPVNVLNPSASLVELTVRKAVLRPEKRGLRYINIHGFIMEHAANQAITTFWKTGSAPQQGLISLRSGRNWVIEGNTIRYAKAIGLDIGGEGQKILDGEVAPNDVGYHLIKNNIISDNGQGGICGLGHIGSRIIGNTIERNNSLGIGVWEEAAIKTHSYINGVIEGNLIRNNYCHGIWLDNVYQNVRVTRNVILSNSGTGIFLEMGSGPCLVDNNIIGNSLMSEGRISGNGIYAHDAGGFTIAHNLLIQNSRFGFYSQMVGERRNSVYPAGITSFDEKPIGDVSSVCSNQNVINNIFIGNAQGMLNMPYPGPKAENNYSDSNLFVEYTGITQCGINSTGGVDKDEIDKVIYSAKAEINENDCISPFVWNCTYLVSLELWGALMGYDKNSRTTKVRNGAWQIIHFGPAPRLMFHMDAGITDVKCEKVEAVDFDFYGNTINDKIVPGPFQQLNEAGNYYLNLQYIEGREKNSSNF